MTTADRIVELLGLYPEGATDNQIAFYLGIPAASVRRTRSKLEDLERVFFQDARGPRRSNRYTSVGPATAWSRDGD